MEQLWNIASPAAIALIHPSLLPVALMAFVAKVLNFTFLDKVRCFILLIERYQEGAKEV